MFVAFSLLRPRLRMKAFLFPLYLQALCRRAAATYFTAILREICFEISATEKYHCIRHIVLAYVERCRCKLRKQSAVHHGQLNLVKIH